MSILAVTLASLGTAADLATLAQTLGTLIARENTYTAAELFARCFRHAFSLRRALLGPLANPPGTDRVSINEPELSRVLSELETDALAVRAIEPNDVARVLAPRFRSTITISGATLDTQSLDTHLEQIIRVTILHFISELPVREQAFREVAHSQLGSLQLGQSELAARIDALFDAVTTILEKIDDEPSNNPTTLQLESAKPDLRNPFRIVTAESFDHNYQLLARLFKAPSEYEAIRSHDNLLIAGGRGCGKSMILKSMSVVPAVEIERLSRHPSPPALTFAESNLDYFGVYLKLFRGFFSQYSPDSKLSEEAAHVFFQHYFNMILLRALLRTILDLSRPVNGAPLLTLTRPAEEQAAAEIAAICQFSLQDRSFDAVITAILGQERHVAQYMGAVRLGAPNAQYGGDFTTVDTFLDGCCQALGRAVPDLRGKRIYFLLDEFENLTTFQQKVVNTLAKLRPTSLSVKVATRAGGLRAMDNLQGDPMQFPRDYHYVGLDYEPGRDFRNLLVEIARRRLEADGFAVTDINVLLPSAPPCAPSTVPEMEDALRLMLAEAGVDVSTLSVETWTEKVHQWREALVFRLNVKRQKPRVYAGVDDFVTLSSGIISNFLELCKMAFYMATWDRVDVRSGQPIPVRTQCEAVYKSSQAAFDWIAKNISDTGPAVSRLIEDLGTVIREKLLLHSSEPEAARITLRDPAALEEDRYANVRGIIDDAVRWSVLQTPQATRAYLPKHRDDDRPNDYLLNRLLHPALRISLNARWPTRVSVADLARLVDADTRTRRRKELIAKHSGRVATKRLRDAGAAPDGDSKHPKLFGGDADDGASE